jgi:hypothetical protein
MEEFPPNSAKSQMPKPAPKPPQKKVEKVVTGEVVVRKKSFTEKFKGVFIGGEAKSAMSYIAYEVLLPAFRNMVVDATSKGIERIIYGDSSPRRPSTPGYGPRVQYNSPSRSASRAPMRTERAMGYSRPQETRRESVELLFASREEADTVLDTMASIIDQYEVVSVADLHELAGLPANHTDNKWGWTNLAQARTQQTREGYVINFPPVEPI